ncbi:MAG: ABC transporter substrate-binding protein [Gemmatimonadaceae bacterium]
MYARGPSLTVLLLFLPLFLAATATPASPQSSPHIALRIGVLIPSAASATRQSRSVLAGLRLGASEARQTAALFGDDAIFYEAEAADERSALVAAEKLLSRRQVQVLVSTSLALTDALSRFAESHRIIFLNVASRRSDVREACRRYTFHVEASSEMYDAAPKLIRTSAKSPPTSPADRRDSVVLWSAQLEKFGAAQLNDRYRDRFRVGMDGGAWAGWMAAKVVAEAALRARSVSAARLVTYMEARSTRFDGHKGWPLSFRLEDHQLRQPLYIVVPPANDRASAQVHDVPELGSLSSGDADDQAGNRLLDQLSPAATSHQCNWERRN